VKLEHWLGGVCVGAGIASLFWSSPAAASIFLVGGFILVALGNIRTDVQR
jgi:hypothetical protein